MKTATSVSRLLLLAAASSVSIALAERAQAQESAAVPREAEQEEGEGQNIIVTGSNIRSAELNASVPLQVVGRQEIESFGATQFSDIFKAIPGNSGSEAYTEAQPRAGVSQFNLRGLGYASTLTLINGRRAGVSPLSDATGSEFVDINQFPLAMVQRVDVLKDGASAIYGSDAVAGVVNIITRRGFEGLELSGGYQDAVNRNWNVNLATGTRFDGGFINLYATYYGQTGAARSDFDWLIERAGGNGVIGRSQFLLNTGSPTTFRLAGQNVAGQIIEAPGSVPFADPDCEAGGGVFRILDSGAVDRSQCLFDFTDQVGIIPEASRVSVMAEFEYALSDRLRLFGEASYSRNVLTSLKGPGSYSNGLVTNGGIFVPASHPFNFYQRDPADPNRLIYIDPAQWDPAIHTAVDVVARSRILGKEFQNGERRAQTDYLRGVAGVEVELSDTWLASLSYQYASVTFTETEDYRFRADALNAALIAGTLNPFGTSIAQPDLISPKDGVSRAGNSQNVIDQVFTTSITRADTEQHVVDALVTGTLFDLPAGALSLAIGGQYRSLTLNELPDTLQAAGEGDTRNLAFPVHGKRTVFAAYAEAFAPITDFSDVQLAVRYEDYGDPVGSSINPKLAARVTPMRGVTLRGSIGTSFQGPTIRQTSESLARVFLTDSAVVDNGVLRCALPGEVRPTGGNVLVRTVGDDSLRPQSSRNFNLGIVVSPARNLQLSADYWNYRYKDLIAAGANAQAIVDNDCASDGIPNDPRINRVDRGIVDITTSFVNVGRVVTDGFDFSGSYAFAIEGLARFQLSTDITYVNKFDVIGGEGGAFDGVGSRNFSNNFRPMPRWRGVGTLGFESGRVGGTLSVRYIDGYRNDQSNDAPISSWTTVDASLSYGFPLLAGDRPLVITIGADNLFDRDPPSLIRHDANGNLISGTITDVNRPGYDAFSGADLRGRILYVRLRQNF